MNRGLVIQPGDGSGVYLLAGMIDAYLDISSLLESSSPQLKLDLKGVKDINSVGVKKWEEAMQQLKDSGKSVAYQGCSTPFVSQCNFVPELSAGIEVYSLYVIFECEECDAYLTQKFETKDLDLDNLPPEVSCPECGELMQTEDQIVFDFLKQ